MKLQIIPSDHFQMQTVRTKEQVQFILGNHIGKDIFAEKKLWGARYEDSFKIYPNFSKFYRSCAVILGELKAEEEGIVLDVRVRPHRFVQVWLCGWSLCLPFGLLVLLSGDLHLASLLFGVFLLGWGSVTGIFHWELHRVKKQFQKMFDRPIERIKNKTGKKV